MGLYVLRRLLCTVGSISVCITTKSTPKLNVITSMNRQQNNLLIYCKSEIR